MVLSSNTLSTAFKAYVLKTASVKNEAIFKRLLPYGKGKLPIDGIINIQQVVIIFPYPLR